MALLLRGNQLLRTGCAALSACVIAEEKKDSIRISISVASNVFFVCFVCSFHRDSYSDLLFYAESVS